MTLLALLFACASTPACGEGTVLVDGQCVVDTGEHEDADDTGASDDTGDTSDTEDTEPTTTGADAPNILSFSTNVTRLTRGETVQFSVVVTDPQGIDNLIGGVLENPNGGTYGNFTTSAAEGSYGLQLSWNDIDQVESIDFDGGENSRFFRARFYDEEGHESTKTVSVKLHCNGLGACDGTCRDLQQDEDNCGTCGNECSVDGTCDDGACLEEVCWDGAMTKTCSDVCGTFGGTCVALHQESGGGFGFVAAYASVDCPSPSYSEGTSLASCTERFVDAQSDASYARCACSF